MTETSLLDGLRSVAPQHSEAEFAKLTRRLATSIVRQVPRPGGGEWNAEDVADLAQDFWVSGRALKAILSARNDEHLAALVAQSIRQLAIDQLRAADETGMHERVSDVLKKGPFVRHGRAWGVAGFVEGEIWQGSIGELVEAGWAVPVTVMRLRADAKRRSSYASRTHFEALLEAVLATAGVPVPLSVLVEVCSHRLGQLATVVDAEVDAATPFQDPEASTVGRLVAEAIWMQLTDSQKAVVPYLNLSARDAAGIVGLGRSAVNVAQGAVKQIVADECQEMSEEERIHLVRCLCVLHNDDVKAGQSPTMLRGR